MVNTPTVTINNAPVVSPSPTTKEFIQNEKKVIEEVKQPTEPKPHI